MVVGYFVVWRSFIPRPARKYPDKVAAAAQRAARRRTSKGNLDRAGELSHLTRANWWPRCRKKAGADAVKSGVGLRMLIAAGVFGVGVSDGVNAWAMRASPSKIPARPVAGDIA